MPYIPASFSADSPSEIVHCDGMSGLTIRQPSVVELSCSWLRGKPFSGFRSTQGARLIDSTPPTTTVDASPVSIMRLACMAASRLEPQRRLILAPGGGGGGAAGKTALPATVRVSSPGALASP